MFLLNYEILEEREEFFLSCAQGCDIAAEDGGWSI